MPKVVYEHSFETGSQPTKRSELQRNGGGSGIRAHDTVPREHALQACALSRSAIADGAAVVAQPVCNLETAVKKGHHNKV